MDKKKKILLIVITILLITIGVTFAYFMAKTGDGVSKNLNVTSDVVDDLKFSVSKDLSLSINQFNFGEDAGNLSDEVVASASLKANSTKKTATYNYYVYFQIESNGFIYTTTGKLPEVVLSITGPNGEVTSIDGLTYVSAANADGTVVKGFDITEIGNSVVKIADNYEITSSSSTNYTNQDWTFKVTFINLNTNQLGNDGKSLVGKVLIQKDVVPLSISEVSSSGDNLASSISLLYSKSVSSFANLYYHDATLENGAEDNSYRYAGANPNNYVCFGSDEETCPVDNLYRIIGVFDGRVKLIKADYATTSLLGTDGDYSGFDITGVNGWYKGTLDSVGRYYFNYNANNKNSNIWSTSLLNNVNLNTNYLNSFESKWADMIDTTNWKVGGNTYDNIAYSVPSVAYQNEIVNSATNTTYEAKVGLMYASDYGFAAGPSAWTRVISDNFGEGYSHSSVTSINWLYLGLPEFSITRFSDSTFAYLFITAHGYAESTDMIPMYAVRPVFYLSSSVKFSSGDGTISSPYRIGV